MTVSDEIGGLPAPPDGSFDAIMASSLFLVLPGRELMLAEAHRGLKPGTRRFMAKPRSAPRASLPLPAMRQLAGLETPFRGNLDRYREPGRGST